MSTQVDVTATIMRLLLAAWFLSVLGFQTFLFFQVFPSDQFRVTRLWFYGISYEIDDRVGPKALRIIDAVHTVIPLCISTSINPCFATSSYQSEHNYDLRPKSCQLQSPKLSLRRGHLCPVYTQARQLH
ncbi:hypothetical protein B0H11DRAFT_766733 [Mycena galericulata]|nr:hypothetical protein B0H11DRAFT_766733 [Mycena galericulata]